MIKQKLLKCLSGYLKRTHRKVSDRLICESEGVISQSIDCKEHIYRINFDFLVAKYWCIQEDKFLSHNELDLCILRF